MNGTNGCFETNQLTHPNVINDSHIQSSQSQTKVTFHNTQSVSWNEDYSQRLAAFMKNSKDLLENIEKSHNVNFKDKELKDMHGDKIINSDAQSPTNALIELEEKLLLLDDSKQPSNKTDATVLSKLTNNNKDQNEFAEHRKTTTAKKHNFQEALRIDELESKLFKLQNELDEKEVKMKNLQFELEHERKHKQTPKKVSYRNLVTEFNNESTYENGKKGINYQDKIQYLTPDKVNNEYQTSYEKNLDKIQNEFQESEKSNFVNNMSIEDYNPNNSVALKNKIKDLESQIQDLHEANELASHFVSAVKNTSDDPWSDPNNVIPELIKRNKNLTDQVEKLRDYVVLLNGEFASSGCLKKELEVLKEDIFNLKEQNNTIFVENIQLKNFIKKNKNLLTDEINFQDISQKQKRKYHKNSSKNTIKSEMVNEDLNHKYNLEDEVKNNMERDFYCMNNDNCSLKRSDIEMTNDSTDSIFSELNKEMDKINVVSDYEHKEILHYNNEKAIHDGSMYSKPSFFQLLNESKCITPATKLSPDSLMKFSTLGRTAFSPHNADDIDVNDVVKFIRQGGRISKGLVHFIGKLPKRNDIYLGIELELEDGKHDGIYEGIRYFQCRKNKGVFVAFNKIIMVYSEKTRKQ